MSIETAEALTQALINYSQLQKKASDKFEELHAKASEQYQCKIGCHSCCKPNLEISLVEKLALKVALENRPALVRVIEDNIAKNPFRGKRCSFLDETGSCLIYEYRPLVCRTHGAPIQLRSKEDLYVRDVCQLNFKTVDLLQLPAEEVLNGETLNVILSLINQQLAQVLGLNKKESLKRFKLELESIIKM